MIAKPIGMSTVLKSMMMIAAYESPEYSLALCFMLRS